LKNTYWSWTEQRASRTISDDESTCVRRLTTSLVRGPVATNEMNTSFIRPIQAKRKVIIVRAEVLSKSRSLFLLEANATQPDGKRIAISKVTTRATPLLFASLACEVIARAYF
jgi:acyl-coenzyme A thioesterase PaaI-like protein